LPAIKKSAPIVGRGSDSGEEEKQKKSGRFSTLDQHQQAKIVLKLWRKAFNMSLAVAVVLQ